MSFQYFLELTHENIIYKSIRINISIKIIFNLYYDYKSI